MVRSRESEPRRRVSAVSRVGMRRRGWGPTKSRPSPNRRGDVFYADTDRCFTEIHTATSRQQSCGIISRLLVAMDCFGAGAPLGLFVVAENELVLYLFQRRPGAGSESDVPAGLRTLAISGEPYFGLRAAHRQCRVSSGFESAAV